MKKHIAFTLISLTLAFFITACATVGKPFPSEAVGRIKIGETSRDEINVFFGPPWRTGIEDGLQTWTYGHYNYSFFGQPSTKDLVIRFNDQGTVVSYTYSATADTVDAP